MKPAFALDFRNDAVGLLHRSAGGWQMVGSVALDTPDLAEALNYLRSTALGLSPKGITTKLIIPDDQILYTTVTAPGPTAAERLAQVTAALEGRTPYDVADLAFDILGDGPEVTVAVIAKETLAEAEAFAVEHRFNPVSFVAVPERKDIKGEPWFGMTAGAANLIGAGKTVTRDSNAVVISQRPRLPEAEAAVEAEVEAAVETPEDLSKIVAQEPEAAAAAAIAEPPAAQPELELSPRPSPSAALAQPLEPARPAPPSTDASSDRELIARLGDALATPIAQPQREDLSLPADAEPPQTLPLDAALPEEDEAPMALDVQPEDGLDDEPQGAAIIRAALAGKSARVTETTIEDPLPPSPVTEPIAGFSSRRVNSAAPVGKAPLLGAARASTTAPPKPAAASKAASAAKRGVGALVNAATAPKRQKVELTKASANAAATLTADVSRKAVPKSAAGFSPRQQVRGKPRYLGLIMTVVLLFLLAMVAAWSSYSLGAWNTDPTDPSQPVMAQSDASLPDAVPDIEDEMAADLQDPAASADGQDSPAPELSAQGPASAATLPQDTAMTAPADGTQDEIYLATVDAPPAAPDPLSLPLPDARGDPLPIAQAAPPPFGTVYQFAADGTIRPTPEGIITPEGVLLRAGRPQVVPAERPAAITAALAAVTPTAPGAGDTAGVPDLPAAAFTEPALIGKLPKPRPANLVPAAPADQGSLAPLAGSRVASLRPQPRPQQRLAAGEGARLASAAASLTTASASLGSASTSPQAIAISRKPVARPKDMSRAVEAAIAAALQQPAPAALASSTAAIALQPLAPEADGEPDVVASNQKTPLRTTVAKQATYKNAINLTKINLIGVYGTQSSRYALVRQSNGRYKKVKVGDSIEGGRIAAITATEVRYQKGNRLIALEMPKD